jgi:hypothetical protein
MYHEQEGIVEKGVEHIIVQDNDVDSCSSSSSSSNDKYSENSKSRVLI